MTSLKPSRSPAARRIQAAAWGAVCCLMLVPGGFAQPSASGPARPLLPLRPATPRNPAKGQPPEHLAQWMDRHKNLPLPQQQKALETEPGFHDLPAQTQQRMRDRLTQLNAMPPEQRKRILERTEAMEQLTPPQRQQVRGAMQQLSALPVDRRRQVARAFRELREMPAAQRPAALASERFQTQFSEGERSTLSNLLSVEPYLPVQRPAEAP